MRHFLLIAPILLGAGAAPAAPVATTPRVAASPLPKNLPDPGPPAPDRWPRPPHPFVCQAFIRPSPYETPKSIGEIRMSEPGDRSVSGGGFRFEVSYDNDPLEPPSINVSVVSESNGKPIERMLFQLDRLKNPSNQFGGFGFTGLHYVYAPNSTAELQYICSSG